MPTILEFKRWCNSFVDDGGNIVVKDGALVVVNNHGEEVAKLDLNPPKAKEEKKEPAPAKAEPAKAGK